MQQQCSDRNPAQQACQGVVAAFSELEAVLPDGGERRRGVGAEGQIIETYDADFLWNPEAHLLALDHCRICDLIVAADKGCYMLVVQQTGQVLFHTVGDVVGTPGEGIISRKPLVVHRLEEGLPAHSHDMGIQCVTEIADPGVAKPS